MRSIFAVLMLLILGGVIVIGLAFKFITDKSYQEEAREEYLHYSQIVSTAIEQNLSAKDISVDDPMLINGVLKNWKRMVGDELIELKLIDRKASLGNDTKGKVSHLYISEQVDEVTIFIPLKLEDYANKALSFSYQSEYSQQHMTYYYASILIGYLVMSFIVAAISWGAYRYINQIRAVTQSVAAGKFDLKMADSGISTLQSLSNDINSMVNTIEEKTSDNLILTAAIHHELRIPMTRLRLAVDMAMYEKSFAAVSELLIGIDEDLEDLTSLTEELLTISRLRLSAMDIKADNVEFPTVLTQVIKSVDSEVVALKLCDYFTLQAKQALVERAIVNVIDNAVKYCHSQVIISGSIVDSSFVVRIEDDGDGIEKALRKLVLKPFYRTDKSRTRKTGGFGLGLAITDMVVKETGGTINILPSSIGGTSVELIWPVA